MSRVPTRRDFDAARLALAGWYAARMPDADGLVVTHLAQAASGGSNETLFATLRFRRNGANETVDHVIRVQPTFFRLFLRNDIERQYHLLVHLHAQGDVPLPAMLFLEKDETIFGAPFWVMEKIDGEVPADAPPYSAAGFLSDAKPAERRRLWASGVAAMAQVNKADIDRLPTLVDAQPGETGFDENLRHWHESMLWATDGAPTPLIAQAWAWLDAHRPTDAPPGLSWGDARIGNMIFRDFECVAVVDWEQVSLGGPLLDLAHWLLIDAALTEGSGLARLEGIGGREETIGLWRDLTGLPVDRLAWYEVFATFRLVVIRTRVARMIATGVAERTIPHVDDFFSRRLADLLCLAPPPPVRVAAQL